MNSEKSMADNTSCYTDLGCFSKGLNFLRQKIIQHAVQTSDWPPPEVIFGSKSSKPYESHSDEFHDSSFTETRKSSVQRQSPSAIQLSTKPKKLKFKSSRTGGLTCVGSADMSTIVAGFVEFERSFNRMSLRKVQSSKIDPIINYSDNDDNGKFQKKFKRIYCNDNVDHHLSVSAKANVDPQLLGHAIELCLKERNKTSDK